MSWISTPQDEAWIEFLISTNVDDKSNRCCYIFREVFALHCVENSAKDTPWSGGSI